MDFNSSIERKFPAANTEAAPHVRKKKPLVPRAGQRLTQLRRSYHTLFVSHPLVAVFRTENYSWVWPMNTTAISLFQLVICRDLRKSN